MSHQVPRKRTRAAVFDHGAGSGHHRNAAGREGGGTNGRDDAAIKLSLVRSVISELSKSSNYEHVVRSWNSEDVEQSVRDTVANVVSEWMGVLEAALPDTKRVLSVLHAIMFIYMWELKVRPKNDEEELLEMDAGGDSLRTAPVERIRRDPKILADMLSWYKRRSKAFDDSSAPNPLTTVDQVALGNGWWTERCPARLRLVIQMCVDNCVVEDEMCVAQNISVYLTRSDIRGLDLMLVDEQVTHLIEEGSLVDVGHGYVTTQAVYRSALSILRMWRTRDARLPSLFGDDIDALLKHRGRELNDGQKALVRCVSLHANCICDAPAGTGKTHTAGFIVNSLTNMKQSSRVVCLTPTHKSLGVLARKMVMCTTKLIEFYTIHKFVIMHRKDKRSDFDDAASEDPDPDIIIVDEFSMVTSPLLQQLLHIMVDMPSTRLLVMGDNSQLPPIGRGWPIMDVPHVIPSCTLMQNMRVSAGREDLKMLAKTLREGTTEVERWLRPEFDAEASVQMIDTLTQSEVIDVVVDAHRKLRASPNPTDPRFIQVITSQRCHVDLINEAIQKVFFRRSGECAVYNRDGTPKQGCPFVHDAVRVNKTTKDYKNGDVGIVTEFIYEEEGAPSERVQEDAPSTAECSSQDGGGRSGEERTLKDATREEKEAARSSGGPDERARQTPAPGAIRKAVVQMLSQSTDAVPNEGDASSRLRHAGKLLHIPVKHIDTAYATTVHKMQGSESSTVIVACFSKTNPRLKSREMFYTSETRSQSRFVVVGNVEDFATAHPSPRRTLLPLLMLEQNDGSTSVGRNRPRNLNVHTRFEEETFQFTIANPGIWTTVKKWFGCACVFCGEDTTSCSPALPWRFDRTIETLRPVCRECSITRFDRSMSLYDNLLHENDERLATLLNKEVALKAAGVHALPWLTKWPFLPETHASLRVCVGCSDDGFW